MADNQPKVRASWEGNLTKMLITITVDDVEKLNLGYYPRDFGKCVQNLCVELSKIITPLKESGIHAKGQIGRVKGKGTVRDTPPDKLAQVNRDRIEIGDDPIWPHIPEQIPAVVEEMKKLGLEPGVHFFLPEAQQ